MNLPEVLRFEASVFEKRRGSIKWTREQGGAGFRQRSAPGRVKQRERRAVSKHLPQAAIWVHGSSNSPLSVSFGEEREEIFQPLGIAKHMIGFETEAIATCATEDEQLQGKVCFRIARRADKTLNRLCRIAHIKADGHMWLILRKWHPLEMRFFHAERS